MPELAKSKAAKRRKQLLSRLRRRGRSGSAAIEFAFIAPVFLLFLFGTLELGLIFLSGLVLQNATNDAARQIRTGKAALSNMTQAQFRQLICDSAAPLLACDSNLQIDVEAFPSFGTVSMTNPIQSDGTLDPSLNHWTPGTVCSVVLVRAFYTWTVATPLLTPFLVNIGSDKRLLSAAAAFRTEPYSTTVSGC